MLLRGLFTGRDDADMAEFGTVANINGQGLLRRIIRGGLVVRFYIVGSLTLLMLMKGHVGDGSGSKRLQGAWYSVKLAVVVHVLHTPCKICAGTAP